MSGGEGNPYYNTPAGINKNGYVPERQSDNRDPFLEYKDSKNEKQSGTYNRPVVGNNYNNFNSSGNQSKQYTIYEFKKIVGNGLGSNLQGNKKEENWNPANARYDIVEASNPSSLYSGTSSFRKAYTPKEIYPGQKFVDDFKLELSDLEQFHSKKTGKNQDSSKNHFALRSIYEFYDKEFDIFDERFYKESFIEYQSYYPSFISEFCMIDKEYLKTIFITKQINKQRFYKYFIRRNGEYYVDYIDDVIPVDANTQLPILGLNVKEPWKLLLFKAWLKEKKGFNGVIGAQPFEFIEAFGVPGYRALSIKKQLNFLLTSKIEEETKEKKQQKIPLNIPGFITVGKTRNNIAVEELGLLKNHAGYRILPIENFSQSASAVRKSQIQQSHSMGKSSIIQQNQDALYKVVSPLIQQWVGSYSPVVPNDKLKTSYNPKTFNLNLQKEFIASYKEVSEVFSKFYITPEYETKFERGNMIQDSISLNVRETPYYFHFNVTGQGFLNVNIDLPFNSFQEEKRGDKTVKRYATIKYFMGRVEDSGKEIEKPGINQLNPQFACKYYDGDYVRGYHKSCNRFLDLQPGNYYIYVKVDNQGFPQSNTFAINISSNAKISTFREVNPKEEEKATFIQTTLYNYTTRHGLKTYINKEEKDSCIYLCNTFDEIGFGLISIKILKKVNGIKLAMIASEKLAGLQIKICKEAYSPEVNLPYTSIATIEDWKILILEKFNRKKYGTANFPPNDLVDFYEIGSSKPVKK